MKSNEEIIEEYFKQLDKYLETEEHWFSCIGFSEGCTCCLYGDKPGIHGNEDWRPMLEKYFKEALQAKDEQARQEKIELVDDVFWRVKDIREMLQTEHSYGLDEWSTPVKNLKILEEKLTQLKDENQ